MIWGGTAPFVVFLASGFIRWVHNEHIAPRGLPVPTPPPPRPLLSPVPSSPGSSPHLSHVSPLIPRGTL